MGQRDPREPYPGLKREGEAALRAARGHLRGGGLRTQEGRTRVGPGDDFLWQVPTGRC